MKIIQDGNLERITKPMRFKCNECGCVFEAEKGEYKYELSGKNEDMYKCECPYCHKKGYVDRILMRDY